MVDNVLHHQMDCGRSQSTIVDANKAAIPKHDKFEAL